VNQYRVSFLALISTNYCHAVPDMKHPLDATDYPPDSRRQPLNQDVGDGRYVYVQDAMDVIWLVPDDAPHLHPRVLGHGQPAKYAGDITFQHGKIVDVTNCSGTFQFDDAEGLYRIAGLIRQVGWKIESGSVRLFSHTQSARPVILE
jgi:hypothetical protein